MQLAWVKPAGIGLSAAAATFVLALFVRTLDPMMLLFGTVAAGGFLLVLKFL